MTLPRGGLGSTSLGAVGGPRGVAAGGLRILIEFISQYDPQAVKQLEADLAELQGLQDRFGDRQIRLADRLAKVEERQAKARATLLASIKNLDKTQAAAATRELKGIEAGLGGSPRQRAQAKKDLELFIGDLRKSGSLTSAEAKQVAQMVRLETQRRSLSTQLNNAKKTAVGIAEQQVGVEQQLTRFQALRQQLPQRLGGLAIGAIGGLVGGAIIGTGFQAAQAIIDRVGEALQDLIDPARHARENIKELSDQVDKLAEAQKISKLAALKKILGEVGIAVDDVTAHNLQEAITTQKANEAIQQRAEYTDIIKNNEALRKSNLQSLTEELLRQAIAEGKHVTLLRNGLGVIGGTINGVNVLTLAQQEYQEILAGLVATEQDDIRAKNQQAAAAFALTLAQNALNAAASAYVASQSTNLDKQIEALQGTGGASARTKALERKIASLSSSGSGVGAQLKNIAEERQLILLRQRLRLLGTNINLERYSGKFLLEAINAKIAALQKEANQQDRLNRLLDLQYRMSQTIKRQAGESINDFLERRAQENRQLLSEQRDIEREQEVERLRDLQEKTQDEVKLKELAEQRKTALAQAGSSARLKALQKELEKSRDADRKALAAKIQTLQDQKQALETASADALKISSAEHLAELNNFIKMSKSINDLAKASGEIRGLEQAKSFLQAVLSSGILPADQAAAVKQAIAAIIGTLKNYTYKFNQLAYGSRASIQIQKEAKYGFQHGGVFPLNNSMSPFGPNIRFGESGTELGIVLSNKVTQALKASQGKGIGELNFYSMPMEDKYSYAYKIKETVREVIREELRG